MEFLPVETFESPIGHYLMQHYCFVSILQCLLAYDKVIIITIRHTITVFLLFSTLCFSADEDKN